jgi:hypothetical protein
MAVVDIYLSAPSRAIEVGKKVSGGELAQAGGIGAGTLLGG